MGDNPTCIRQKPWYNADNPPKEMRTMTCMLSRMNIVDNAHVTMGAFGVAYYRYYYAHSAR